MNGSFTFGAIIIGAAIILDGYLDREATRQSAEEREKKYLNSCYNSDPDNAKLPANQIRHACLKEYLHGQR